MSDPACPAVQDCPVCGCASPASLVHGLHRWRAHEFAIARCADCGSARSHPLPTREMLRTLYAEEFDYRWYRDHLAAKRRDGATRLAEYADLIGARMLDYGGGLGYMSELARAKGIDSVTYDPYARPGDAAAPERGAWDSVVALHVLEHSDDPQSTLLDMRSFLRPGGRLVLAVPNYAGLGYRTLGMRWVWAQPPLIHVFHFTAAGLVALLRRSGFHAPAVSFHERWDANSEADVRQAARFRAMDADWGSGVLSRFGWYRRFVAGRNTRARWEALEIARRAAAPTDASLAELQVVASII